MADEWIESTSQVVAGTVSMVIPAFRASDTIVRAVASLKRQTYAPVEIIVVADDSSSYQRPLAEAGLDKGVVFHSTGTTGAGPCAARAVGQAVARGEYIGRLDADNTVDPDYLARLVPLAAQYGAAGANVAAVREIEGGTVLLTVGSLLPPGQGPVMLSADTLLKDTYLPLALLVRRHLVASWDPLLRMGEDFLYNLQVMAKAGPIPVERALMGRHYIRKGSYTYGWRGVYKARSAYTYLAQVLESGRAGIKNRGTIVTAIDAFHMRFERSESYGRFLRAHPGVSFPEFASHGYAAAAFPPPQPRPRDEALGGLDPARDLGIA